MADAGQIEQVVMNIVINAADAMPQGGSLRIETEVTMLDNDACSEGMTPGRYAKLSIRDTAAAWMRKRGNHVFEPFFSTKGDRGTGLGMAMVYGIIKQHGGHVEISSRLGAGTTVSLYPPHIRRLQR